MTSVSLLPVFLVGLAGSVHCVGMCGGIVGALSAGTSARVPIQVQGLPLRQPTVASVSFAPLLRVGAYNGGRLLSYSVAGALAGGLTGGALLLLQLPQLQHALLWAANLMLVALGLFLLDAWRLLAWLETLGGGLWRAISPLIGRLRQQPGRASYARLFALGALWGWIPCGMVYSALATAMLSGSAIGGAEVMLAFGLGTLPMLVLLGTAGQGVRRFLRQAWVRRCCGLVIVAFGVAGLVRAGHGAAPGWLDLLCIAAGGA